MVAVEILGFDAVPWLELESVMLSLMNFPTSDDVKVYVELVAPLIEV